MREGSKEMRQKYIRQMGRDLKCCWEDGRVGGGNMLSEVHLHDSTAGYEEVLSGCFRHAKRRCVNERRKPEIQGECNDVEICHPDTYYV